MVKHFLQIPCQKIISGGQTGVDRGTLDACLNNDFPCGGWCPKGRLAEDGILSDKYPLIEMKEREYSFRTRQNVIDSDGTLILSSGKMTGGTLLTKQIANEFKKPVLIIAPATNTQNIIKWLIKNDIKILNVAGPRQSEWKEGYSASFKIISNLICEINISFRRKS
jgi:predicted Rossmann fold nucleotide-binding protein DprA/Smf involved in DNA uptake